MSKRFTNDFRFCYPILERNIPNFLEKALSVSKNDNSLLELRLDYLLSSDINFDEILKLVNDISRSVGSDRLIVTIRTKADGGEVNLSDEVYCQYIKDLYIKASVKYIDVEYEYYKRHVEYFNVLFNNKIKNIILSKHIFDGALKNDEYEKLFSDMNVPLVNIVKFAIKLETESELYDYMMVARESSKYIHKDGKNCIFIAMGEIGRLSRLWPEFTNTKIVFLTAYGEKANKIGQLGYEDFVKYRKLLEKIDKN